ncbi:MAG: PD-(D/E)XK nuclease family protein [Actinomycetota bacterium]
MPLTSVQERTLVELMASKEERPVFSADLADGLRSTLEKRLAPIAERIDDGDQLWATKARLTNLHLRCEGLFAANEFREGEFEYGFKLAVGNVTHKAVEVSVFRPGVPEAELVQRALEKLRRDDSRFDEYVERLDDVDHAEIEAESVRRTTLFRATLPPIERAWAPVVELPLKVELLDRRVVLYGQPDISLGSQDEEDPMRARRLFLELKTGQDRPEYDEDLRFYALCATLRFGVPPFRVATLLLDDGTWRIQDVTPDLLEAAARRVVGYFERAIDLVNGAEPALRPGAWCAWCPRRNTCPESTAKDPVVVGESQAVRSSPVRGVRGESSPQTDRAR